MAVPYKFNAFAIKDTDEFSFDKIELEFPELQSYDCLIRIQYCGVSHSDVLVSAGTVPGHEVIGIIEDVGTSVKNLEPGATVGIGWQLSSCHVCKFCVAGKENLCPNKKSFKDSQFGGFGEFIVWDARFVYCIPEQLSPIEAGPLLTAGATAFAPLKELDIPPTSRIGILGIGGVGHLAIKFAKAWGCHVVAISSSKSKQEEAKRFGADEFVVMDNEENGLLAVQPLDVIFSTIAVSVNWDNCFNALNPYGKFIMLGAIAFPMLVDPKLLIQRKITLIGSLAASPSCIRYMLEFASSHSIRPEIEMMEMSVDNCQIALQRVISNQPRYRIVLKNLNFEIIEEFPESEDSEQDASNDDDDN